MTPSFNIEILTSYHPLNQYDICINQLYSRIEVMEHSNGMYTQAVYINDQLIAKTVYNKLGVLESIITYHNNNIEIIRVVRNDIVLVTNVVQNGNSLNVSADEIFQTSHINLLSNVNDTKINHNIINQLMSV